MADAKARFRIEGEDATAAAFNSALGRAQSTATKISRAFNVAFSFIAGNAIVQSVTEATLKFERINTTLKVVSGSARAAGESFGYISELSYRLGLDLATTAQGFASFSAAAMGTSLEGQQTRQIFEAVATAARALSLSSDDTEGALRALSQMISKGNVQAEELRGQLGERLPGAFQLAARAMGVTTGELNKMLEQGQVAATDLLPKLAVELQKTFGKGAQEAADSLGANVSRLATAWDTFKAAVGDTLPIKEATKALAGLFSGAAEVIRDGDSSVQNQLRVALENLERAKVGGDAEMIRRIEARIATLENSLPRDFSKSAGVFAPGSSSSSEAPRPAAVIEPDKKALKAAADKALQARRDAFDSYASGLRAASEAQEELTKLIEKAKVDGDEYLQDAFQEWEPYFEDTARALEQQFDQVSDYSRRAAENMQDAFANFLFDPFKDGLKGMLRGFIDVIRQMVAQQAAAQIFGSKASGGSGFGDFLSGALGSFFGGFRANGGPVSAGKGYVVGERGPELFLPRSSGSIVPNGGGGMTIAPVYNIDARGATQDVIRMLPAILEANTQRTLELARAQTRDDISRRAMR
jgi:tape measure domain-containing protein